MHPEDCDHMRDIVVEETVQDIDKNKASHSAYSDSGGRSLLQNYDIYTEMHCRTASSTSRSTSGTCTVPLTTPNWTERSPTGCSPSAKCSRSTETRTPTENSTRYGKWCREVAAREIFHSERLVNLGLELHGQWSVEVVWGWKQWSTTNFSDEFNEIY